MNKYIIAGLLAAVAGAAQAGNNICYEYPIDKTNLTQSYTKKISSDKIQDITKNVDTSDYRLIIAKSAKKTKLNWHYIYLIRKSSGKTISWQSLECTPHRGISGGYDCHGECDSGELYIDRNNDIRIKYSLDLGDSIDLPEGTYEVNASGLLRAKETACTKDIDAEDITKNDDEVSDSYVEMVEKNQKIPARYVCYNSKTISSKNGNSVPKYEGCIASKDSCRDIGLLHFGHYNSATATNEALIRCRESAPREKRK